MRAIVLNGVNLDQLGKRDPTIYGGVSLPELETRIYEWGTELGCTGAFLRMRLLAQCIEQADQSEPALPRRQPASCPAAAWCRFRPTCRRPTTRSMSRAS